jgi:hypothetical protein
VVECYSPQSIGEQTREAKVKNHSRSLKIIKLTCWGGGMADTRALRALIRKGVRVRLPPSALFTSVQSKLAKEALCLALYTFWNVQMECIIRA